MRIRRKNNELSDVIEVLDERFREAHDDVSAAWASLSKNELDYVDGELDKCVSDRRYYLENYHTIRDEHGNIQTLYPFWDHQEIIYEVLERQYKKNGCFRGIILKPRQCGGTVWSAGVTFHATIFTPQAYTLMMAHEDDASAEIERRVMYAYNHLPWWMRPEISTKRMERHVVFERQDENRISVDPMGSTLMISNAQKGAGIAIGRSIRCLHASEVSRWPSAQVWTSDIKPSMNARDMLAIMESTAFGRNGLFWNMWKSAESGKSNWTPIFIPVYKVRKYFMPLDKGEKFFLTPDEKSLRQKIEAEENFKIPLGFFKWRRSDIQETENAEGSDESHYESYPVTPGEAFINSGFCAFPKKCINDQERKYVRDPIKIGEIRLVGLDSPPELVLHKPEAGELLEKPEIRNRFWVWETPEDGQEYYVAADVSSGDGSDYSCAEVFKRGHGPTPDTQVAEWHGLINPSHFARTIAAIGVWYNLAEIAVEYQQSGITTGNELLQNIDYPNLYRWKHQDKLSNSSTNYVHWITSHKTRPEAINRTCEGLLDQTLIIRSHHLLEEMRDFARLEEGGKQEGIDNNDDMVMATIICICAMREQTRMSGGWEEGTEGAKQGPAFPAVFGIYDQFMRQVAQTDTKEHALEIIKKNEEKYKIKLPWSVRPIQAMKANTPFSPIHDGSGAESILHNQYGMEDRDIRPDIVQSYRDLLTVQHYQEGDD